MSCFLGATLGHAQSTEIVSSEPAGAPLGTKTSGWNFQPQPLAQIPAGTAFVDQPPAGWSHIVLFVESRLASGDVEVVSKTVEHYCQLLKPVVLANVRQTDRGHMLEQVAIGFTTLVDGQHTVITSETYRQLGASLGLIGGHVLAGNERMLNDFQQVARSPLNMVIDTPVIMLHNDQHVDMTMRLAVWVTPTSGQLGTAVWLLDENGAEGEYSVVEETFHFVPAGTWEDRVLNVKKNRFTFGIPAADAFAMVRLPPGTPFRIPASLQEQAGRRQFDAASYRELWSALGNALQQPPASATE
jgi:hypothetical protein